LGLTYGFCATSAASLITRTWFHRHSGTVLGLVTASSGIGGTVMTVLQSMALEKGGFRLSLGLSSGILLVIALLCFLFIRNHPRDKGLVPLGEGEEIVGRSRKISREAVPGLSMRHLKKRPCFYLILFASFLSAFCAYMAFSFVRPYVLDCGFSSAQAGTVQSVMFLLLSLSKFVCGFLCDYISPKWVNLASIGAITVGLGSLAMGGSFSFVLVAVVIYSLSLPLLSILPPLLAFSLFGYRAQAQYTGIFIACIYAASFFAELVSNFLYDRFGSYSPAFFCAAGIALGIILLSLFLYRLAEADLRNTAFQEE
jgi:sugar phosphate permease